jgi:hypothetical protein
MPVPQQLQRKLREVLGTDAADNLVDMLDSLDANRGDFGELRHEMQLGFARIEARFAQIDARFEQLLGQINGRFEKELGQINVRFEQQNALLEKGLKEQTRFFFVAWAVILASVIGLYAR